MADLLGSTIDGGRLRLDEILGLGAYGVVYRTTDLVTGLTYAVKTLQTNDLTPRQALFQRREIALHVRVSLAQAEDPAMSLSPSVVPLRRLIKNDPLAPHALFVVLDLYPDGDLFSLIADQRRFIDDDPRITCVFLQLINAVSLCHKNSIYHRDLKPENILCRHNPNASSPYDIHIVLADFGLATDQTLSFDWGCGSSFYMSPECHGPADVSQRKPYDSAPNDVWSLGVILVNLVCARNPWRQANFDDPAFAAYVENPDIIQTLLPVSDDCAYILKRIFTLDPKKRVTLDELRTLVLSVNKWALSDHEISLRQKQQVPQQKSQQQQQQQQSQQPQQSKHHHNYNHNVVVQQEQEQEPHIPTPEPTLDSSSISYHSIDHHHHQTYQDDDNIIGQDNVVVNNVDIESSIQNDVEHEQRHDNKQEQYRPNFITLSSQFSSASNSSLSSRHSNSSSCVGDVEDSSPNTSPSQLPARSLTFSSFESYSPPATNSTAPLPNVNTPPIKSSMHHHYHQHQHHHSHQYHLNHQVFPANPSPPESPYSTVNRSSYHNLPPPPYYESSATGYNNDNKTNNINNNHNINSVNKHSASENSSKISSTCSNKDVDIKKSLLFGGGGGYGSKNLWWPFSAKNNNKEKKLNNHNHNHNNSDIHNHNYNKHDNYFNDSPVSSSSYSLMDLDMPVTPSPSDHTSPLPHFNATPPTTTPTNSNSNSNANTVLNGYPSPPLNDSSTFLPGGNDGNNNNQHQKLMALHKEAFNTAQTPSPLSSNRASRPRRRTRITPFVA